METTSMIIGAILSFVFFIECIFMGEMKAKISGIFSAVKITLFILFIIIFVIQKQNEIKKALQGKSEYHLEIKNTYQNNKLIKSDTLLIKNK